MASAGRKDKSGSPEAALSPEEARALARRTPRWALSAGKIERDFEFKDFREAMAFVNKVADLAEAQGHHPDIFISYKAVRLTLSTHKVGGLSQKDFALASKIDEALASPPSVGARRR